MKEYKEKVHEMLTTYKSEGINLLKRLVNERSVQNHEESVQAIVIEYLRSLGLQIDVWEPDINELRAHPAFVSTRETFKGSPNVVGLLRGSGGGRSLILNGHIDVVPEGDIAWWDSDPYEAVVKDGKVYGRGATDMKGGNVSMLLALKVLKELKVSLKGDVIFQSVIEEESGGAGTLSCILRGYKADGALIPEPTNMKIFPSQQGSAWFRIKVKGRSAHGGTRYEGVSAIEKAQKVLHHLNRLEKIRNEEITSPLYKNVPIPIPINVGKVSGGSWPSSVPDEVILEGRLGIGPHESIHDAKKMVETSLLTLSEEDEWFALHPAEVSWFGAHWLPSEVEETHPLIKCLTDAYSLICKKEPTVEASPWGTDGGLLTNCAKTPAIIFGPGVTEVAHFPNEYIEIESVFQTAEIIALTMLDWCGVKE
jgi:acetylornithine deacetylase